MNTGTKLYKQHGFTLLELMIVLAIIMILASIAMGTYKSHVQRAKYTEVINALAPLKTALEACYIRYGLVSKCDDAITGDGSTANEHITNARDSAMTPNYIQDVEVIYHSLSSIDIKITGSAELLNATYIVKGIPNGNTIGWTRDLTNSSCYELNYCQ